MCEGICMLFDKATVQSMFKHVASANSPSAFILPSLIFSNFHFKAHCLKFTGITLHNVCAVHRVDIMSTLWDIVINVGENHWENN